MHFKIKPVNIIYLKGVRIAIDSHCKYLGHIVSDDLSDNRDLNRQLSLFLKIYYFQDMYFTNKTDIDHIKIIFNFSQFSALYDFQSEPLHGGQKFFYGVTPLFYLSC